MALIALRIPSVSSYRNRMATESTESTDPHTTTGCGCFPLWPRQRESKPAVFSLMAYKGTGRGWVATKKKGCVVAGYSVDSVDSAAITGGAEGPTSFTAGSRRNVLTIPSIFW